MVLLDVLSRRNSDLNQDNLANPFRVFCEEYFKRMKLLRDTLDIVETVNANDQFNALEFTLKRGNALLDLWFLEALFEFLGVNANWECANGDDLSLELDGVRSCGQLTAR